MTDDDAWITELENSPLFIVSQLRVGHVLSEDDVKRIGVLLSSLDDQENAEVEAFHDGRLNAFREIGGEDLVTSVQIKDAESIARHVKKAMDAMFPKTQRNKH